MIGEIINKLMTWLSPRISRMENINIKMLITVLFTFLTLGIAVWSIEQARWINPQPSLILVLFTSVITAFIISKFKLARKILVPLVFLVGLIITFWQSVQLFNVTGAGSAIQSWWYSLTHVPLNEGTFFFALFLIVITWITGFFATWFIVKRNNIWITVFMGTLMILVNLSNLPKSSYYIFPIYLVMALILIVQANLTKQDMLFRKLGTNPHYRGIASFMVTVLLVSGLAVGSIWSLPETSIDQMGIAVGANTESGVLNAQTWFNIFAEVRSKWSVKTGSELENILFEKPIQTGRRIQYIISADRSGYWRTRRYDIYYPWGWSSTTTAEKPLESEMIYENSSEIPADYEYVTYTVENRLKTDVVLTNGEFVSADMPVELYILSTTALETETTDTSDTSTGMIATDEEKQSEDVIMVVSPYIFKPYQQYTVTVLNKVFSQEDLINDTGDYPQEITDYYLQLPDSLPSRIHILSDDITGTSETVYEKVVAVKDFLGNYKYNLDVDTPPEDADGVDYFLFDLQEGTCLNYASAAAVLLRSADVPARLCVGYRQGELDQETGRIVLRSDNYHAWIEVYFPTYGWVEIETTPVSDTDDTAFVGIGENSTDIEELPYILEIDVSLPSGGSGVSTINRQEGTDNSLAAYIILAVSLVMAAILARLLYNRWLQRLIRITAPEEAYARMCHLASFRKFNPYTNETPLEYSNRLTMALPSQATAINKVTQAYVDTRYGPRKELPQMEKARLQKFWVQFCPWLLRRLLRINRFSEISTAEPEPEVDFDIEQEVEITEEEFVSITGLTSPLRAGENGYYVVCEDLFKIYKLADLEVVALRGLDLKVKGGEIIAIVGTSGSGKSTLLNILGGLETPSAGKVTVGGKDLLNISGHELIDYRRNDMGFVWQQVGRNLVPYLTAYQNVELPLILLGWSRSKRKKRVKELLTAVGLRNRMQYKPDRLSGGEQQRVAITVALAHDPPLLLADEPTGELDSQTATGILDLFYVINKRYGTTIIIVTHDAGIIKAVDRIVTIRDGRTSEERIKKHKISKDDEEAEDVDDFVVVDNAGRMQIPREHMDKLQVKRRVKIVEDSDHISVWPVDSGDES